MALIIIGSTKCGICGKILSAKDEITGLPPSSSHDNPLHHYFDQGFHQSCFDNWEKKNEVLEIVKKERNESYFAKRVCKRCNPNLYYNVPEFTKDEKLELLQIKQELPIKAVKALMNSFKLNHGDAKFIVMHLNDEYGECNRCNFDNLTGEYANCPKCNSLNFNWKI